jgi:inorganic pyrophosphatase
MNIVERIKELNFPIGQYVIIGSGPLDALGIRTANDIDIAVTPELFKTLRTSGEWEEEERYGKIFLKRSGVDINPELCWSDYLTTTEEAIASALVIDGVPFMNLEELKRFKTALGREKDKADIALIEKYQQNAALRFLGLPVTIAIDRPLGSKHPKWDFVYPINYGYVPNTNSGDEEEIDAYVLGVKEPLKEFTGKCIAVIHRLNDDDDKLILATDNTDFTDTEIRVTTEFQEKFFKAVIVR